MVNSTRTILLFVHGNWYISTRAFINNRATLYEKKQYDLCAKLDGRQRKHQFGLVWVFVVAVCIPRFFMRPAKANPDKCAHIIKPFFIRIKLTIITNVLVQLINSKTRASIFPGVFFPFMRIFISFWQRKMFKLTNLINYQKVMNTDQCFDVAWNWIARFSLFSFFLFSLPFLYHLIPYIEKTLQWAPQGTPLFTRKNKFFHDEDIYAILYNRWNMGLGILIMQWFCK